MFPPFIMLFSCPPPFGFVCDSGHESRLLRVLCQTLVDGEKPIKGYTQPQDSFHRNRNSLMVFGEQQLSLCCEGVYISADDLCLLWVSAAMC